MIFWNALDVLKRADFPAAAVGLPKSHLVNSDAFYRAALAEKKSNKVFGKNQTLGKRIK